MDSLPHFVKEADQIPVYPLEFQQRCFKRNIVSSKSLFRLLKSIKCHSSWSVLCFLQNSASGQSSSTRPVTRIAIVLPSMFYSYPFLNSFYIFVVVSISETVFHIKTILFFLSNLVHLATTYPSGIMKFIIYLSVEWSVCNRNFLPCRHLQKFSIGLT